MNKRQKLFVRMVLSSLVRRRSRMIVALLAIVVGATILLGLTLIYYDVPRQMSAQFRSYGANVIFMPEEGASLTPEALKAAVDTLPAQEVEGYTPYRYENTQIHHLPVTLAGIDFDSVMKTSPYWHISGDMPASNGEALFGAKVAESLGVKVGDTIEAVNTFEITDETDMSLIPDYEVYSDPETGERFCDHALSMKVTGLLDTGGSEEEYIYVSHDDVTYLTMNDRGYDIVEISVANILSQLETYVDGINENVPSVSARLVKRVTASESTVLTKLQSLVFIVTAVVLILTMICVATTMTAVIAERRREIALRKALGASNGSIVTQFMTEGLLLGGVGGILGSILGYLFAQMVSVNVFSSVITFRFILLPITILASVLVTGLACLIPIRSAVNVDPALVLKGE